MVGHAAVLELADDAGQATVLLQHLHCDLQHRALALLRADAKHVFQQPVQQSHATLCFVSTPSAILRDRQSVAPPATRWGVFLDSVQEPGVATATLPVTLERSRGAARKNPQVVGWKLDKRFAAAGGEVAVAAKAQRAEFEQLFLAV